LTLFDRKQGFNYQSGGALFFVFYLQILNTRSFIMATRAVASAVFNQSIDVVWKHVREFGASL